METLCNANPLVMYITGHYPVMETTHPFMETHNHLWKPFLKNKELSFVETIFENKASLRKISVFDA
jgi:hypothetical protein